MNLSIQCRQAKQIDMVSYLEYLGFTPKRISGNDCWYLSPFREEKVPSFKINRVLNAWYDHGMGRGGTIIDFGVLYHRCSISAFLHQLSSHSSFHQPSPNKAQAENGTDNEISILSVTGIRDLRLIRYLRKRKIDLEIACSYCKEINYSLYKKKYTAIGFENRSGGFELRNAYFKASSSPKDITLIANDSNSIHVFEGFFDFLSFQTLNKNFESPLTNFLVLNSLAFFSKAKSIMEQYKEILLFLDRDAAGTQMTKYALSIDKRYEDRSCQYEKFKDINEFLMQNKHSETRGLKTGRRF